MSSRGPLRWSDLNWLLILAFAVSVALFVRSGDYILPSELWDSLFLKVVGAGLVLGFAFIGRARANGERRFPMSSDGFWDWCRYLGRTVGAGIALGLGGFSTLVIVNGACAEGEIHQAAAIVTSKEKSREGAVGPRTRSGRPHFVLNIRLRDEGVSFRIAVSESEFDSIYPGEPRAVDVRRGFLGWPFRVK